MGFLFSFSGKVNRLQFVGLTLGNGLIFLVLIVALIWFSFGGIDLEAGADRQNVMDIFGAGLQVFFGIIILSILSTWIALGAAFRRSRDISEGTLYGWIYLVLMFLPMLVSFTTEISNISSQNAAGSSPELPTGVIIAYLISFAFWLFMAIKEGQIFDISRMEREAFGSFQDAGFNGASAQTSYESAISRQPESSSWLSEQKPAAEPAQKQSSGFGRRQAPSFGRR